MPEIRSFRAIRYDFERFGGDLSEVVSPPYDVLDQADKDALSSKNPYNIVTVDLPHIPPKEEGPQQAYLDAQFSLDMWEAEGVLVREESPAFYLYHQTFEFCGTTYTRRQFICALRLHAFEEGIVLPHEKTFGGPKADRLALTKETQCNLSPVFGLYTDPDDCIGKAFHATAQRKPDAIANLNGVRNELWVVTNAETIASVCGEMAAKKIFIADGHHRYTTALNYRDILVSHQGELPDDHPAGFVMVVLASMDDSGCVIQGYNRVLHGDGVTADALVAAWADGTTSSEESAADLTLCDGATRAKTFLRFTNRSVLDTLAPDRHPSWRKLDVAYLHTYLIDKLATDALGKAPQIRYVTSVEDACSTAKEIGGVAVLPKATPMAQLRAVSEAGELMPQKSTFFYPKLATGLTIHPLTPDE